MRLKSSQAEEKGAQSGKVRIIRPLNAFLAGASGVLAYLFSNPFSEEAFFVFFSVFFITGAGNAINDYFDAERDKKTKKKRPIPSGIISKSEAKHFSSLLFLLGILFSALLSPINLFFALIASFLEIIYPWKLKDYKVLGNITVAFLSALVFPYGARFRDPFMNILFGVSFLFSLAREITKDLEDFSQKEKRTLPKIIGKKPSKMVIFLLSLFSLFSAVYFVKGLSDLYYVFLVFPALFTLLSLRRVFEGNYREAQLLQKKAMISMISAFVAGRFF